MIPRLERVKTKSMGHPRRKVLTLCYFAAGPFPLIRQRSKIHGYLAAPERIQFIDAPGIHLGSPAIVVGGQGNSVPAARLLKLASGFMDYTEQIE